MTGAAKMAMISSRGRDTRYEGPRDEMENHYPQMWSEPESRRRDSRGRFVRGYSAEVMGNNTNTTETMRYGSDARNHGERWERDPLERAPMQIGFRMDEDMSRYRTDTTYPRMVETEHRKSPMNKGHALGLGHGKLDRKTAEAWVDKMVTVDNYKGKRWGLEQTGQIMMQMGIDCDPLEFFVAMNMMFSDYGKVAEEMGLDNEYFYAQMAKAFLKDPDAVPDKLMAYYEAIPK